jgi:hypothetical protein
MKKTIYVRVKNPNLFYEQINGMYSNNHLWTMLTPFKVQRDSPVPFTEMEQQAKVNIELTRKGALLTELISYPGSWGIDLTYDPNDLSDSESQRIAVMVDFLRKHPRVAEMLPNLGYQPQADLLLFDEEQWVKGNIDNHAVVLRAQNVVNQVASSPEAKGTLANIAFSLGLPRFEGDAARLELALNKELNTSDKAQRFLDLWMSGDDAQQRDLKVLAQQAIESGVFAQEGSAWTLNGAAICNITEEGNELIAFLVENPDQQTKVREKTARYVQRVYGLSQAGATTPLEFGEEKALRDQIKVLKTENESLKAQLLELSTKMTASTTPGRKPSTKPEHTF